MQHLTERAARRDSHPLPVPSNSTPANANAQPAQERSDAERLIRLNEVKQLTGLGRTTIYAGMAAGTFPRCVQITGRAVAWKHSEVAAWANSRPATPVRGQKQGA